MVPQPRAALWFVLMRCPSKVRSHEESIAVHLINSASRLTTMIIRWCEVNTGSLASVEIRVGAVCPVNDSTASTHPVNIIIC